MGGYVKQTLTPTRPGLKDPDGLSQAPMIPGKLKLTGLQALEMPTPMVPTHEDTGNLWVRKLTHRQPLNARRAPTHDGDNR